MVDFRIGFLVGNDHYFINCLYPELARGKCEPG